MQCALDVGLTDRDFVQPAAKRAPDFKRFRPRCAKALDICLDAGGHPALGLGTCEEQLRHGTLQFQRRFLGGAAWPLMGYSTTTDIQCRVNLGTKLYIESGRACSDRDVTE